MSDFTHKQLHVRTHTSLTHAALGDLQNGVLILVGTPFPKSSITMGSWFEYA